MSPYGASKKTMGENRFPADGHPAQAAGKPGLGGKGGTIYSTVDILSGYGVSVVQSGGLSGPQGSLQKGSRGGNPNPAKKQFYNYNEPGGCMKTTNTSSEPTHSSKPGKDAPAPPADKPNGDPGTFSKINGQSYIWLTPINLQIAIQYIRDVYLNGHLESVQTWLTTYGNALDTYANPSADFVVYFSQASNEITTLQNRLTSNLDYFGNPAGWVPELSFEANLVVYKSQVKMAIQQMYLSYRVGLAVQKDQSIVGMLSNGINQLNSEIEDAIKQYNTAEGEIPSIEAQIAGLNKELNTLMSKIEALQKKLLKEAKGIVAEENAIKFAMRIFAGILQIIPVGQPILGEVGDGLNIITNIDINKPLDTFDQLGKLFGKMSGNFKSSAEEAGKEQKKVDTSKPEDAGISGKNLLDAAKNLMNGAKTITKAFGGLKASNSEVEAVLKRLEAENVEYQFLAGEIRDMNKSKEKLGEQLAKVLKELLEANNTVVSALQKINVFYQQRTTVVSELDQQAITFAKSMGNTARAELVKYQYYLIKAYQYRILKPFQGANYQLNYIFDAFAKLTNTNTDGVLSAADYNTLSTVYQTPLSKMANEIISEYESQPIEYQSQLNVPLSDAQLNQLNTSGSVTINLMDMGDWNYSHLGVRITEINTSTIEFENGQSFKEMDGGSEEASSPVQVQLLYLHEGLSKLRSTDGKIYGFNPNQNQSNMRWGSDYNFDAPSGKKLTPIKPSPLAQNLLDELLNDSSSCKNAALTDYRPSGWANITITKSVLPLGSTAEIKKLVLQFNFVFINAPANQSALVVQTNEGYMPLISVKPTDLNGANNGYGGFYRVYAQSQQVDLSVSSTYGKLKFSKWTNPKGDVLGTDPSLTLNLDQNTVVTCNFEEPSK